MDRLIKKLMNHGFSKAKAVIFIGEVAEELGAVMKDSIQRKLMEEAMSADVKHEG